MNGTMNDAEQRAFSEREKFVSAFNETMLKIWKEQMTLLDVIVATDPCGWAIY